jgi:hypothetical protein
MKKSIAALILAATAALTLTACTDDDADVVSENISKDADNFKILRRITAINGVTDKYLLTIEGFCNVVADREDKQLEVTCKVGDEQYIKDFVGLSDNSPYIVEQLRSANVSKDHYKVTLKPSTVVPDIEVR